MMSDRFSAQLRQHLLETANERPAEGHLAAIVQSVAVTRQRRPLDLRLPDLRGRFGSLPAAARYGLIAAALVLAAVAGALIAGAGASHRSTPFEGSWTTVDPADGSTMNLYVGEGLHPTVRFEDLHATGDACLNDDVKVFTADGVGHVNDERLDATYPNGGGCGLRTVSIGGMYVYNAEADLLVDQDGLIWARIPRGDGPLPTLPPEPTPTEPTATVLPTPSTPFEGRWTATDAGDGSTLTLVVGESAAPIVQFQDDLSTGGACTADKVKVFRADGMGEITGNRLLAFYPDGGGCGGTVVPIGGRYDYDAESDTLVDQDGVIWTRMSVDDPAPSLWPAPSVPAPTLSGGCVDLTHGGTFTDIVGSVSLTATIPATPVVSWYGGRKQFELAGSCEDGSPMAFHAVPTTEIGDDSSCTGKGGEVTSFADAIARLDFPQGPDISARIDLTIDGYRAARYDVTELSTCAGFGLWGGTILGQGETGSIYVIDVDGTFVEIELNRDGSQTQAELDEAHAIIESLQINP